MVVRVVRELPTPNLDLTLLIVSSYATSRRLPHHRIRTNATACNLFCACHSHLSVGYNVDPVIHHCFISRSPSVSHQNCRGCMRKADARKMPMGMLSPEGARRQGSRQANVSVSMTAQFPGIVTAFREFQIGSQCSSECNFMCRWPF